MELEKIIADLNTRFAQPRREFYNRRIIWWQDDDREFEDAIPELQLEGAKVLVLNGHNSYAAKKLLVEDDPYSSYLVYCPLTFSRPEDNWLINVQLYSEEFRADLNSIWMDEMGLPSTPVLREQVKGYRKFFNAKERRAKVAAMSAKITTAAQLHTAVMSALAALGQTQPNGAYGALLA